MTSRRTVWFVIGALFVSVFLPSTRVDGQESDPEATIVALQTQVATLSTPAATPPAESPTDATPPAESDSSSPRVVNVELILDVSGSMGQIIDTGETRMEAAKRILNEVLAAVPDQPGINIGLRIYGHEGDNSEAG